MVCQHVAVTRLPWVPLVAVFLLAVVAASGVMATSAAVFLLVLAVFTGAMALLADRYRKR
jgi:hypothetical protein